LTYITAPRQAICYSSNKLPRSFFLRIACLLLLIIISDLSHAENRITPFESSTTIPIKTSLIMPLVTGAAKTIYEDIAEGIRSNSDLKISILMIDKASSIEMVEQHILENNSELVIALGNTSYRLAALLPIDTMVIAGGITGNQSLRPTLSLSSDPESALKELKRIAPHIEDVMMVYNESINGWWYNKAKKIAPKYGFNIIGYNAKNIKAGVESYQKLLDDASPKTSAIWLPLRNIVPSKTILPMLLERAWGKKLAVFSNNPSHTKLGGLMAIYPEHQKMGSQLAEFAADHFQGKTNDPVIGTQELRIAINLRTSSHIGIRLSATDQARFDKIYPTQR
tara:strand:+ start:6227 stop:7240 length:1014 start_codon:yes stop_codon:yes gene_type:complete